jgi:hypothetical protein
MYTALSAPVMKCIEDGTVVTMEHVNYAVIAPPHDNFSALP